MRYGRIALVCEGVWAEELSLLLLLQVLQFLCWLPVYLGWRGYCEGRKGCYQGDCVV